jgi:hypothetical protein
MEDLAYNFLMQCKANYFNKITPSNDKVISDKGYQNLIRIAKAYFNIGEINDFAGYFQEGQYFVALWTAHLIIEYGKPDELLKTDALAVIRKYSDNPLAPDVANEEKLWLERNNL